MSLKRQRDLGGSSILPCITDGEKTPSKKPKKVPQQKATVTKVPFTKATAVASNAEDHIIERIKKCLELANHPTASESEAKAAMFLADRMMSKYNVATADLLAKESQEHLAQHAGSSEVSINSIKGDSHRVVHQGFVSTLAQSMMVFFDCKSYSTRRAVGIVWTFYGIAENTAAAAQAFEMIHNKILDWACAYSGASASFSYCKGFADGLWSLAHRQKAQETEKARKQEEETLAARDLAEKTQRQRELERLKGRSEDMTVEDSFQTYSKNNDRDGNLLPYKSIFVDCSNVPLDDTSRDNYCTEDGHGDNDDSGGGDSLETEIEPDFKLDGGELLNDAAELDEEIEKVLRRKSRLANRLNVEFKSPKVTKPDTCDPTHVRSISCWASEMQLVKFRVTAEQVADEYLKAANIKLGKNRAQQTTVKDREAYLQGKEDSKKVDVRQKLVE